MKVEVIKFEYHDSRCDHEKEVIAMAMRREKKQYWHLLPRGYVADSSSVVPSYQALEPYNKEVNLASLAYLPFGQSVFGPSSDGVGGRVACRLPLSILFCDSSERFQLTNLHPMVCSTTYR